MSAPERHRQQDRPLWEEPGMTALANVEEGPQPLEAVDQSRSPSSAPARRAARRTAAIAVLAQPSLCYGVSLVLIDLHQ